MFPIHKVAIIGAGAAGLAAARNLKYTYHLDVTVFEQWKAVSGTWDITNPKSSMYENLRTNLPCRVMEYPDFPFTDVLDDDDYGQRSAKSENGEGKRLWSFPTHNQVKEYLERYAQHFDLYPLIQLNTTVTEATFVKSSNKWRITTTSAGHPSKVEEFDALVVCNGHYSNPKFPDNIPGLEEFGKQPGKLVIHSHYYKSPSLFSKYKKIIALGAGPSGVDITIDLAEVYKDAQLILSHRHVDVSKPNYQIIYGNRLPNLTQRPAIHHVDVQQDRVYFDDGSFAEHVDAILLATGYHYSLPFFKDPDTAALVQVSDGNVAPLYKYVFSIEQPTLALLGLVWSVAPFPLMHYQSCFVGAIYTGQKKLPTKEDMYADLKQDTVRRKQMGQPSHFALMLRDDQWEYNRLLASLAGVPADSPVRKSMYVDCGNTRKVDPITYRYQRYVPLGPGERDFRVLSPDSQDITPP